MTTDALRTLALVLLSFAFLAGCGDGGGDATAVEDPTELTPEQIEYERQLAN